MAAIDTFYEVRWYPNQVYLKFFSSNMSLRLGSLMPQVRAFLLQREGVWGDPAPFDLTDYTIVFHLYDANGNLILEQIGAVGPTNEDTGEILYSWQQFDIQKAGTYYGSFALSNGNEIFELPSSMNRLYITVV